MLFVALLVIGAATARADAYSLNVTSAATVADIVAVEVELRFSGLGAYKVDATKHFEPVISSIVTASLTATIEEIQLFADAQLVVDNHLAQVFDATLQLLQPRRRALQLVSCQDIIPVAQA